MARLIAICFVLGMGWMITIPLSAQGDDCTAIVERAIEQTADVCQAVGRNEACYGKTEITAVGRSETFTFNTSGDIVNISEIESMQAMPYDPESGVWGISVLKLQANLPNTSPGQNATLLVTGDTSIENSIEQQTGIEATINANARIRSTPSSANNTNLITSLNAGTAVTAIGRNDGGDWIRIRYDGGELGWTAEFLLNSSGDFSSLPIVAADDAPSLNPMQAFTVRTGIGDTSCDNAPDGLLVQTPAGVASVSLTVNGVEVNLGSTLFFQTVDNALTIAVIEGRAYVTTVIEDESTTQLIPAGTFTTVPLSDDLTQPVGAASDPQPYDAIQYATLPVQTESTLAETDVIEAIEIAEPPADVEAAIEEQFYPNGALNGRYLLTRVSRNPVTGTSELLCPAGDSQTFEEVMDWENIIYPGGFNRTVTEIAPGRFGDSDADHASTLVPPAAPDDNSFTNYAVSWTITSPMTYTYHVTSSQHRSSVGPQACDQVWEAVWIGP